MNWPPLTAECSQAIAAALKSTVEAKPKDLFEFVAQQLQEKSGLDPAEFEKHFEECRLKPRTYVLEDRCPASQDPLSWVPMRYNDDTIFSTLQQRAGELVADILSSDLVQDTEAFLDGFLVAFPELTYLRGSPQELAAFQTLRAIYLGCSGSPSVMQSLDDANAQLSFRCEALVDSAREQLFEPVAKDPVDVEVLVLFCILRALGSHAGFQKRYGGGLSTPELAVLHAVEHEPQSLPSFARMDPEHKQLIVEVLQVYFPLGMLVSTEAVPAHFLNVKELMSRVEGSLPFLLAAAAVEHLVKFRSLLVGDDAVDLLRVGTQCLAAVEKYSAARAYELYLKKRAERHSWRLVKDDFLHRAIVRLCCLAGQEDEEAWSEMMKTAEDLSNHEKEVLKLELGRKDGLGEAPAYVPAGAGALLARAAGPGGGPSLRSAVRLVVRVLEDAARTFDRLPNRKTVRLLFEDLDARAREYGGGAPFEDTPFTLEELLPGEVAARPAGGGA